MAASVRERLATLEASEAQHRKELGLFWDAKKLRDAEMVDLKASVAKVCAWQKKVGERFRYWGRVALFFIAATCLQFASGAWAKIFETLVRRLVGSLV